MKTAYLIAFLDVRRSPPTVAEVRIVSDSESAITLDLSKFRATRIAFAVRDTYAEAKLELEHRVLREQGLAWCRGLMRGQVRG